MPPATLLRARTVITCTPDQRQHAISWERLGLIHNGAVLFENGVVLSVGEQHEVERFAQQRYRNARDSVEIVDFSREVVVPGFVDAHSHPLFAGDREPDFAARMRGEKPKLGMLYTVERTRDALLDPAVFWTNTVEPRLRMIARHGTTTLETKTGYALHAPGEFALLDLIHEHRDDSGLPRLLPTFLGAHALPPEFRNEVDFVDYLIDQVVPAACAHGAIYADAFCEPGFFSPEQTRRYLLAARSHGLRLRVHCDEMAYGHAAEMACEIGVDAVDHANCITDADVAAIAQTHAVTVACPATIAYLGLPQRAPVRALLERGADVAFASDYNPGTSPCMNLQTVAYFARREFGVSAPEALYGVTHAAARSLRMQTGAIRAGSPADLVVLGIDSPDEFGWQFGGNLARAVYRSGRLIA